VHKLSFLRFQKKFLVLNEPGMQRECMGYAKGLKCKNQSELFKNQREVYPF